MYIGRIQCSHEPLASLHLQGISPPARFAMLHVPGRFDGLQAVSSSFLNRTSPKTTSSPSSLHFRPEETNSRSTDKGSPMVNDDGDDAELGRRDPWLWLLVFRDGQ